MQSACADLPLPAQRPARLNRLRSGDVPRPVAATMDAAECGVGECWGTDRSRTLEKAWFGSVARDFRYCMGERHCEFGLDGERDETNSDWAGGMWKGRRNSRGGPERVAGC